MEKGDLRFVQQGLESQLKAAVSGRASGESIRIHQVADPVDMTQEAAEREVAGQLLDRESAVIRHLGSALARVNNGSYGICIECEEEISPTRLKAIPWAELCIRCQQRAEDCENEREPISDFEDRPQAA
jgi:DnaK suppressor protein